MVRLIGRESDLAHVAARLDASPLVTLTGVGGVGKTSLAAAAVEVAEARFRDGTAWVDLAAIRSVDGVATAFHRALGISDPGERTPAEAIVAAVERRQMLVVVDNAEHVIEAVRDLVAPLVRDCPGAGVLVTSREPLALPGESQFAVGPLADEAARELFAERVRERDPAWEAGADEALVQQIAGTLDGIPLALELAAALVGPITLADLAENLSHALDMGGRGGARPRHVTLRSALAWSHDLLDDEERTVLRRLSVFAGGFAINSVAQVCSSDGIDAQNTLRRLVRRSLVVARDPGTGRYDLLEVVRQFAAERLELAGERERYIERHVAHFADLAEESEEPLRTGDSVRWHRRLVADYPNLLAALEYGRGEVALSPDATRLVARLHWWWLYFEGRAAECRLWLERAAEPVNAGQPTFHSARAGIALGLADVMFGDPERAQQRRLDICLLALGDADPLAAGTARALLGIPAALAGTPKDRDRFAVEMAQGFEGCDAPDFAAWLAAAIDTLVGLFAGETERRWRGNERRVEAARRMGDPMCLSGPLAALSHLALADGDVDQAAKLLREAISLLRQFGGGWNAAVQVVMAAAVAAARNDWDSAARLVGASDGMFQRRGGRTNTVSQEELSACAGRCRKALGNRHFEQLHQAGHRLGDDAALALAAETLKERSAASGITALTRRQHEVVELIAAGHTNREIAAELVISEHTAERHVENILKALNLNSRLQIATWYLREPELSR
ncbi:MAG TPA: LuxR C-terminal-related transcriptional regulator [Actinomycetota bacterium]|nr:LuxR C-terminal-related transcriptional regulator [Actinomycetota bacterium]